MDAGSAKHDFERVSENTSRTSGRMLRMLSRIFSRLFKRAYRYYNKHRSSSMKAIKKDGATEEVTATPPLTKEEAKEVITKARESNVLVGVREMTPEGDLGRNKSLAKQEKMAKHEIKANKWKERGNNFKKIAVISNMCYKQAKSHSEKAKKDSILGKAERYVMIFNKSKTPFMEERLAEIQEKRISQLSNNELEDINKDGLVDERDVTELKTLDIELSKDELSEIGQDYGTCLVKSYNDNFCTQKITKDEYCAMRPEMWGMSSHGAVVFNENEVIVAFPTSELGAYRRYAPIDKPIKEYGLLGGKSIEQESNTNDLIPVELENEQDFNKFRDKYKEKDFLAVHNGDGTVSCLVRESDTKEMVHEIQTKKSSTEELLKEAKEFQERNNVKVLDDATDSIGKGLDELEDLELSRDR